MADEHTCYSMDFIGLPLNDGTLPKTSEVKVAVIDSAESVKDYHTMETPYPPSLEPVKFESFQKCSNELRFSGHGTHCASILCGRLQDANFFDIADGSIRGVLTLPYLHLYALCKCKSCNVDSTLITKAIATATADKVRIISMSIGYAEEKIPTSYEDDYIGHETLKALKENVLTIQSAGNHGPLNRSIYAVPWTAHSGACASGKLLVTKVEVGVTGQPKDTPILAVHGDVKILDTVEGVSFNLFGETDFHPLQISKDVRGQNSVISSPTGNNDHSTMSLYEEEKMDFDVKVSPVHHPRAIIHRTSTNQLCRLKTNFGKVHVRILRSQFRDDGRKAIIPGFSSRGPSNIFEEFIKPNLVAPGYGVVSFWPTDEPIFRPKTREPVFNDQMAKSGTSSACPHIAGAAVMVLDKYPFLSPMGVLSALMTSAKSLAEEKGIPGNEFTYGAGILQLAKALFPGLIYDELAARFEKFLEKITEAKDLNLPSFCKSFPIKKGVQVCVFPRELTYIGDKPVTYKSEAKVFKSFFGSVKIKAVPNQLTFNKFGDKKTFNLIVEANVVRSGFVSAILKWKSPGLNDVCSPIHLFEKRYYDVPSAAKATSSKRQKTSVSAAHEESNPEEIASQQMEKLSIGMEDEQCSASYSGQNDD